MALLSPNLKAAIEKANSVYILVPQQYTFDTFAAGLALQQGLAQTGKTVYIASPVQVKETYLQLPGAQVVTNEIGNRNLVITLQLHSHEDIDKVSYHINEAENTFNLVIQPKADVDPIAKDNINYAYTGANADLVFLIGSQRYEDFGHFYELEQKLFTDTETVAINRLSNGNFANHHISDAESSSLSETIYHLLKELGQPVVSDQTATVIMAGMDFATNQLQSPVIRPETFEIVADLIRSGARRGIAINQPAMAPAMPAYSSPFGAPVSPNPFSASPYAKPAMPGMSPMPTPMPMQPVEAVQPQATVQPQVPVQPQTPIQPQPVVQPQPIKAGNGVQTPNKPKGQKPPRPAQPAPKQHQPQPGNQGRLS